MYIMYIKFFLCYYFKSWLPFTTKIPLFITNIFNIIFSVELRPNAGHGLLILKVSYSTHNDTPQSVGLLWTSDQLVAETSTWQHTTITKDKYPCPPVGFEPTISAGERPQTFATLTHNLAKYRPGASTHELATFRPLIWIQWLSKYRKGIRTHTLVLLMDTRIFSVGNGLKFYVKANKLQLSME